MIEPSFARPLRIPRPQYQHYFEQAIDQVGQSAKNVLVFYGEAGIGKTELMRSLGQNYRSQCVVLNGAGMKRHNALSLEAAIETLLIELYRDGIWLENFAVAYAYYLNWAHLGRSFDATNAARQAERGDILSTFGDLIGTIAQDLQAQVPFVGTISKLSWFAFRYMKNPGRHRDRLKQLDDCSDPFQLLDELPKFFMETLQQALENTDKKVAILVDGYEAFLDETGTCFWLEDMMAIENPWVLWVLFAKDAIAQLPTPQQRQIQPLTYEESLEWLRTLGIEAAEIGQAIALAAKGIPFYLRVGVETWNAIRKDRLPRAEDFAPDLQASLNRLGQVWQAEELKLFQLLAFPRSWDQRLFAALVARGQLGEWETRWAQVMASPYVELIEAGQWRSHSLLSQHLRAQCSEAQRAENHQWLFDYYRALYEADQHWQMLAEAVYHGLRGKQPDQAGLWLVEQVPSLQQEYRHREVIALLQMLLHMNGERALRLNAIAKMQLGTSYLEMGRATEAATVLEQSKASWAWLHPEETAEAATVELTLARAYLRDDRTFDAQNASGRAKQIRQALLGEASIGMAEVLNLQAQIAERQGKEREAVLLNQQALEILATQPEGALLQRVQLMKTQALLLAEQNRTDEAAQLCQEAIQIAREAVGTDHPETVLSQALLGWVYEQMGSHQYQRALEQYEQALKVGEPILGSDHPQVLLLLQCLARLCRKVGRFDAADEFVARYNASVQIGNFEEMVETALRLNGLAVLLFKKGEYGRAEPLLLQALEIRKQQLGDDHPDVATGLNNLAELYVKQGRYSEAESFHLQALEIAEKKLGIDHPDTLNSRLNLKMLQLERQLNIPEDS